MKLGMLGLYSIFSKQQAAVGHFLKCVWDLQQKFPAADSGNVGNCWYLCVSIMTER